MPPSLVYGGLGYGPYTILKSNINPGRVSGPLTPVIGDAVATPRGLRPLSLEGFSEDLDQDGFVDPIDPAGHHGQTYAAAPAIGAAPVAAAPAAAAYGAYPYTHVFKREAEAEPGYGYGRSYGYNSGYGYGGYRG